MLQHAELGRSIPVVASKAAVHLWKQVVQIRSHLADRREGLDLLSGVNFGAKAKENSRTRDLLRRVSSTLADLNKFLPEETYHGEGSRESPSRRAQINTTIQEKRTGLSMKGAVGDFQHLRSMMEETSQQGDIQIMVSGTAVTVAESRNAIALSYKLG